MFEQTFKNIDDILHKDAGCGSELDYVEQTSWVLFLKYLDDLEKDKKTAAELSGKTYTNIIAPEYRWNIWATPKGKDGKLDHHKAMTGDDLKDFVDQKLFPYLKKFKTDAESADTIEYKIGEIFSELKNRIQSGYNLREVVNRIDELRFRTHAEKHEMSHLYEDKIKNMGNAGRNGGEYYTPRPLIKTIIKVVAPKIGDKIYDGAVGSAGFLCEAFDYLKASKSLTTKDIEALQKKTFYGKEKKSLAYIIGIMNMILHGVEAPNIIHTNTLAENLADIQEKDRYDIILANPPFGGKERAEVQQNFPIKTGETASLFLQHFIKILKAGGKAGVVIKNTFLSNTDNASVSLRKLLLESCNLHTVLDLPGGTFTGAGVKTVVLFFEKGAPTRNIWYYQLNLSRNLGKNNPLNENDLTDFIELQKTFAESENSWNFKVDLTGSTTLDLSAKNPNKNREAGLRSPKEILDEMKTLEEEGRDILKHTKELFESYLEDVFIDGLTDWETCNLEKYIKLIDYRGRTPVKTSSGVRLITAKNVKLGYLQIEPQEFIDTDEYETWMSRGIPNYGDIIFTTEAPLANVAQINTREKLAFAQRIIVMQPDQSKIDQTFLKYLLLSNPIRKRILESGTGATVLGIKSSLLKKIQISFPKTLLEQRKIVEALNKLSNDSQKLETIYKKKIQDLDELKKSIMRKAFSGESMESERAVLV